jgi:hypothetical protein
VLGATVETEGYILVFSFMGFLAFLAFLAVSKQSSGYVVAPSYAVAPSYVQTPASLR